jgi:hypothetical protein
MAYSIFIFVFVFFFTVRLPQPSCHVNGTTEVMQAPMQNKTFFLLVIGGETDAWSEKVGSRLYGQLMCTGGMRGGPRMRPAARRRASGPGSGIS